MAKEYIEREAAKSELLSWAVCMNHPEYLMRDDALHVIDSIPAADANGVTVQEWISSEEMLPEFPCLALDVNGNSVFIPDGIITIKDKHGEWCINAALAKGVRLIDGTKIDALIWENRIAYWMPLPNLPQPLKGE